MEKKDILTKIEKEVIMQMAESAVFIPKEYVPRKGGEYGNWDRAKRVAVVYSVLCSMFRIKKKEKK